ncbi:hypothetical protein [Winogradskyella sp. UBA3174]|jgi:hypothetical protein|uniref:hypothetical protein n=1 Tax=Winogradskyella sp. UBA3174 TaxID=1947785 RepID=UPI0025D54124|nr:hypothetical protein [Winogradskyella sp. UBA3174]|tara:strand:+ start:25871 stop:26419 length:549 start_codon:yes stop_codon:yes gene_type:complete
MKKLILAVILLNITFVINAQEDNDEETKGIFDRKHEVRLGAVKLLSGGIFEGSYEYILDSNQGFGAYVLVNFDSGNDWFEKYSLTPYYRMYFQTNEDYGAKGFFVEGFTSFFTSDFNIEDSFFGEDNNEDVFDISVGLSLGKKWINTSGFVFEIKFGAGRNLLGNADSDVIIKGDFYIGYRF